MPLALPTACGGVPWVVKRLLGVKKTHGATVLLKSLLKRGLGVAFCFQVSYVTNSQNLRPMDQVDALSYDYYSETYFFEPVGLLLEPYLLKHVVISFYVHGVFCSHKNIGEASSSFIFAKLHVVFLF